MFFALGENPDTDPIIYWPAFFRQGLDLETNTFRAMAMGEALEQVHHFLSLLHATPGMTYADLALQWLDHCEKCHNENEDGLDTARAMAQLMVFAVEMIGMTHAGLVEVFTNSKVQQINLAREQGDDMPDGIIQTPFGTVAQVPSFIVSMSAFIQRAMREFKEEGDTLHEMLHNQQEN